MKLQGVDSAIIVESGNVQMGDALAEHARTAILQSADKYFGGYIGRPSISREKVLAIAVERLLDGEREASLLFVVEDVARELRVPYATALGWVIEFFDEKLVSALAGGDG